MGYMGYRKRTGFCRPHRAQISEFSIVFVAMGITLSHRCRGARSHHLVGLVTIMVSYHMILYSQPLYERLAPLLGVFERARPFRELAVERQGGAAGGRHRCSASAAGARLMRQLRQAGIAVIGVDFDPDRPPAAPSASAGALRRRWGPRLPRIPAARRCALGGDHLPAVGIRTAFPAAPARSAGFKGRIAGVVRDDIHGAALGAAGVERVLNPSTMRPTTRRALRGGDRLRGRPPHGRTCKPAHRARNAGAGSRPPRSPRASPRRTRPPAPGDRTMNPIRSSPHRPLGARPSCRGACRLARAELGARVCRCSTWSIPARSTPCATCSMPTPSGCRKLLEEVRAGQALAAGCTSAHGVTPERCTWRWVACSARSSPTPRAIDADLLVMGRAAQAFMRELLIGSTTGACCKVGLMLVVKQIAHELSPRARAGGLLGARARGAGVRAARGPAASSCCCTPGRGCRSRQTALCRRGESALSSLRVKRAPQARCADEQLVARARVDRTACAASWSRRGYDADPRAGQEQDCDLIVIRQTRPQPARRDAARQRHKRDARAFDRRRAGLRPQAGLRRAAASLAPPAPCLLRPDRIFAPGMLPALCAARPPGRTLALAAPEARRWRTHNENRHCPDDPSAPTTGRWRGGRTVDLHFPSTPGHPLVTNRMSCGKRDAADGPIRLWAGRSSACR